MIKKKRGAALPPMDAGTYPAVCIGIIDLGEQYGDLYKKYAEKVLIMWEIPGQTVTVEGEEKPRWLSKDFAASLNEKSNLFKFLVPWRGKNFTEAELATDGAGFNLKGMLGRGCFLQVVTEEKDDGAKRNKVTTGIALPAGTPAPTTSTEFFSFDMNAWDDAVFAKLPSWVQERIQKSTQYQKLHTPTDTVDFPTAPKPEAKGACPI